MNNITFKLINGTTTTAVYGAAANSSFGGSTGALSFNGTYYASLPPAVFPTGTSYTISVRFKTSTSNAGQLFSFGNSGLGALLADCSIGGGNVTMRISGVNVVTSGTNYSDGNWHTLITTMTSSTLTLYIDGANVGSAASFYTGGTANFASLGYDSGFGLAQYTGLLDEFAIFTGVTSAGAVPTAPYGGGESGIQALYHLDNSGTDSSLAPITFSSYIPAQQPFLTDSTHFYPITTPYLDTATDIPTGISFTTGNISGGNGVYTYNLYISSTPGFTPGSGNLIYTGAFNGYAWTPPDNGLYFAQWIITDTGNGSLSSYQIGVSLNRGHEIILASIGDSLEIYYPVTDQTWLYIPPVSGSGITFTYNGNILSGGNTLAYNATAATIQSALNAAVSSGGLQITNGGSIFASVTAVGSTGMFKIFIPWQLQNTAHNALLVSAGTCYEMDGGTFFKNLMDTVGDNLIAGRNGNNYHAVVFNNGVAGQSSTQWAVGSANYTSFKSSYGPGGNAQSNIVVIILGTNDSAADVRTTAATYYNNILGIVQDVISWGTVSKIILLHPPYPTPGANRANAHSYDSTSVNLMSQYHAQIDAIVAAYPTQVFTDTNKDMWNIQARNSLTLTQDGIHWNVDALFIMGKRIADVIFNAYEGTIGSGVIVTPPSGTQANTVSQFINPSGFSVHPTAGYTMLSDGGSVARIGGGTPVTTITFDVPGGFRTSTYDSSNYLIQSVFKSN